MWRSARSRRDAEAPPRLGLVEAAASRSRRLADLFRKPIGFARRLRWRGEYRRLQAMRGSGAGRRAFLLGSGPSIGAMDLSPLDDEFVCVVNMGVHAIGGAVSHADMHVVTDTNRYRRFATDIEEIARKHPIPYRFISHRTRGVWRSLPERANEPVFLVPHVDRLERRGDVPPLEEGVIRARSVLLTAAVLLEYLGFSPIYVLGCDLSYDKGDTYFYELGPLDRVHENDPKVMARRPGMHAVDGDFAILRRSFAADGHLILNAGSGGNLTSLERIDFATLFPRRDTGPRP